MEGFKSPYKETYMENVIYLHPTVGFEPTFPKVETYRREEPKVSRNSLCPCGSGLKYKKCCMGKEKTDETESV